MNIPIQEDENQYNEEPWYFDEDSDLASVDSDTTPNFSKVNTSTTASIPSPQKNRGLSSEDKKVLSNLANSSSLEIVLADKSPLYRNQILTLMSRLRMSPNDPAFLLVIAMSELEASFVDYPITIQKQLSKFTNQLENTLDNYLSDESAKDRIDEYLLQYKSDVSSAASKIVSTIRDEKFVTSILGISRSLWLALLLLIGAVGLGSFGTVAYYNLVKKSMVAENRLTIEEYNNLQWLEGNEGKLARNLVQWNRDDLQDTSYCQNSAKNLGLKVSWQGKEVSDGFCLLFVEEPSKRK